MKKRNFSTDIFAEVVEAKSSRILSARHGGSCSQTNSEIATLWATGVSPAGWSEESVLLPSRYPILNLASNLLTQLVDGTRIQPVAS
mgnify:CR=1 FL=1